LSGARFHLVRHVLNVVSAVTKAQAREPRQTDLALLKRTRTAATCALSCEGREIIHWSTDAARPVKPVVGARTALAGSSLLSR
jgi:hypothetical protein